MTNLLHYICLLISQCLLIVTVHSHRAGQVLALTGHWWLCDVMIYRHEDDHLHL